MNQWWSWILTAIGVTGLYFVGKKSIWGWAIGVSAQSLWITYAIVTKQWGFIASALAYGTIQAKNLILWCNTEKEKEKEKV